MGSIVHLSSEVQYRECADGVLVLITIITHHNSRDLLFIIFLIVQLKNRLPHWKVGYRGVGHTAPKGFLGVG